MTEDQTKHPLHGIGLKTMLAELVDHYNWEILAEQIPIKCFDSYPSVKSSVKFLHKTEWARQRVEAFYLYRFKNIPLPSDEQHALPPRERVIVLSELDNAPAEVLMGDPEFFDDPLSGPKMPSKKAVEKTRAKTADKPSRRQAQADESNEDKADTQDKPAVDADSEVTNSEVTNSEPGSADPWGKWRK